MSASRENIPKCTNCHLRLPTLLAPDALHFCTEDCCQEWCAKQIGQTTAHEAFSILNDLRSYLAALIARQGTEAALAKLSMKAMHMFKELPLEELCPQSTALAVVTADTEKEVDAGLQFP